MATSGTYLFGQTTTIDDFFRESFERIGMFGNDLVPYNIQSAMMSANLLLTEWMGKGPNSWMRQMFMFTLYKNQPIYQLPNNITQIIEVIATSPQRFNIGGTADSSGVQSGAAANVFNSSISTGCTLSDANGWISYDYGLGNTNSIIYVGIQPLNNGSSYTLAVDYSFDAPADDNWISLYQAPLTVFNSNQIGWFVIQNSLNARAWRVRETGGATLALQQIYFSQPPSNNGPNDRTLTALSAVEWMQIGNKMSPTGFPSSYFFNQQDSVTNQPSSSGPTLYLYAPPNGNYTEILYSCYQYPQDITALFQQFNVPRRYLEALISELAFRLCCKFKIDNSDLRNFLSQQKEIAFANACNTDAPDVTLRLQPDFMSFLKYD